MIEAFASVPRGQFAGPGPWRILSDRYNDALLTSDNDLRRLYHDVLVTIDESRTPRQWDAQILGAQFEHLNGAGRRLIASRATAGR
ncbi:hypothetical protein [Bradyrhizobium sp. NC92]|uniref:hypothetical protein n=1 Tax=Bradyrhizobium sp. (strain NC92) TaxID=55395 RepID=UPI0021AA057C|nr:hypothetical protein [Bradyrhizobium sp. NC92]UWU68174.1 hypothetical protein N2602_34575 [Bradyrhizobium sp. NC92]